MPLWRVRGGAAAPFRAGEAETSYQEHQIRGGGVRSTMRGGTPGSARTWRRRGLSARAVEMIRTHHQPDGPAAELHAVDDAV